MTRTPDAHWMTEARYRGQKVVAVAPDYAENVKFADEWVTTAPGTDGALAMAMGHVVLKEFFVDQDVPFFTDYNKQYTDLPNLICLERVDDDGGGTPVWRPGKYLVAGDIGHPEGGTENAMWKPAVIDAGTGEVRRPAGRHRPPLRRRGRWAGGTSSWATSTRRSRCTPTTRAGPASPSRSSCRASTTPTARSAATGAAYRSRRVGDRLVTTVLDLMLAQYGVAPRRPPGGVADGLRRPDGPRDPRLAGDPHGRPGGPGRAPGPRVGAERDRHRGPRDDPDGGRGQPLVPLRPDLPRDAGAHHDHRLPGPQRRRLGALRGPGEDPPDHGLPAHGLRAGLAPPAAAHEPDGVLVREHQPVPLRHLQRRRPGRRHRDLRRPDRDGPAGAVGAPGLEPELPDVRPQLAGPRRRRGRRGHGGAGVRRRRSSRRAP